MDFSEPGYRKIADRNLNFVLQAQNSDGSWPYSTDEERLFVDHFHTCFVLKALAKIEAITKNPECTKAIERGVDYYVRNLFDERGPVSYTHLDVYKRQAVDSLRQQMRKYVLLEARQSIRNVSQHGSIEHIHSTVYDAGNLSPGLLMKVNDPMKRVELNGSVPRRIGNSPHRHANQSAMFPMKTNELAEIEFQK